MTPVKQADPAVQNLAPFVDAARAAVAAGAPLVVSADDRQFECPPELAAAIFGLLELVGSGQSIEITSLGEELSTGQAADLLGVSRPTVVALVDSGTLSATRVGTHRRLRTVEVLAYRAERRAARSGALDELSSLSDELGLYDR